MNRQGLQALIELALHLRGRLSGTGEGADVAQDTMELSHVAKRLKYLSERTNKDKAEWLEAHAQRIAKRYGYYADCQPPLLYLVPLGQERSDTDLRVPY